MMLVKDLLKGELVRMAPNQAIPHRPGYAQLNPVYAEVIAHSQWRIHPC